MVEEKLKIPKSLNKQVNALIKRGYYSRDEIIKYALRNLFQTNAKLRMLASIELYKEGKVSLGKAAELAGMATIEFKESLKDKGIVREIGESEEELRKSTKKLEKIVSQSSG